MGKHLVLVGGGHAHLAVLEQLARFTSRGHRVTLVSPTPFHDYSGMGPGLLSGRNRLLEARFNIARMATIRGGRFIEATAVGIAPETRTLHLNDETALSYDVISFNTGSEVALPGPAKAVGRTLFPVKPIANLFHARETLLDSDQSRLPRRILVVGGGPAGCEVTGNLQDLACRHELDTEITQVAGTELLDEFSKNVRNRTRELLAREKVRLLEGLHVDTLKNNQARLSDGRTLDFDFALIASGVQPSGPFQGTGLEAQGIPGLAVNSFLQSPFHQEIFGSGDCIHFLPRPLEKVGVHAVRQQPVLIKNLMAALENKPLQKFHPQKRYLLIFDLGLGRAVATGYDISWSGRTALWLKNRIDRNFTKKYRKLT